MPGFAGVPIGDRMTIYTDRHKTLKIQRLEQLRENWKTVFIMTASADRMASAVRAMKVIDRKLAELRAL